MCSLLVFEPGLRQLKGTHENWNTPLVIVLSFPAWHDCWNSWALQVGLSLFFVKPDVPTLLVTHPSILHLSLVRYQNATKNENQKDPIIVSWGLSWGELFSNAFYTERRYRHCHVEFQHLGLVFTCIYVRSPPIFLDICTSQEGLQYIIKKKRNIFLLDHILCIIESCI